MDFGKVTLDQLSKITDRNNAKAIQLNVKLSWTIIDDNVLAKISDESHVCEQENFPLNRHFHLILIDIQHWYWQKLNEMEDLFSAKSPPVDTRVKRWKKGEGFKPID